MKTIKTKAYGEIQVDDNSEIEFVKPILGFEEYREYYLLEMKDIQQFYWLQSKTDSELAFIVVNPRIFKPDYVLDVEDQDIAELKLENDEEMLDFVIANIPEDPSKMTINLLGPLVFNVNKRLAMQAISNRNDYETKHNVFSVKK